MTPERKRRLILLILLFAAAAKRHRGKLLGGDKGDLLIAEADAQFVAQNIRCPDRFAAMLAPGFPGS